ncbi:hypothetical protein GCM10011385_36730 [Nitratireductor aestuarii]|uniref:Cytochrome c domain-containing protein n=1 Tax=Nitratireductor aestuarii TaxID=1735103 RepID=A0A916WA00_9HYPH|nr:hypothetical protein [Nitratireductor aestuarii]GGA79201.1 hypothetical protein GCM10011385_36730 [Nitratireductor aestuarii]
MIRLRMLPPVLLGLALGAGSTATGASAQQLDLDEVFRCSGETVSQDNCLAARQVLLNDCTTCHTFVPIVMQSFDENGWRGLLTRHVENGRVTQVPPEQIENLRLYLAENFNGDLPPPDLPPALLETWTSY